MELKIQKTEKAKPKPDQTKLGFGQIFTDHMFSMDYEQGKGWHNPRIEPYAPIIMDPSSMMLHYGQGVFDGLKAYRTDSEHIQLFRPMENIKRLSNSSRRLCIPEFDQTLVLNWLKELIKIEKDWVPKEPGTSLYIRPTIIAMDPFLGVRASFKYRFFIILSPVGAYYPEGFSSIKIMVAKDHVRASSGGVGEAKTAGNYAASLYAGEIAKKQGYTQVLWLDAISRRYVEEVGSMNIFFVIKNTLITPALNGSILPGITRDSVIALAKKDGIEVKETQISIDQIFEAHQKGELLEVFGTGTAAIVSPVGELKYSDRVIKIGDGQAGPIAGRFFKELMDIQYGKVQDPSGWIERVI